jgi:integrase
MSVQGIDSAVLIQMLMSDPIRVRICEQMQRPLLGRPGHLAEYAESLKQCGDGEKHVRDSVQRTRKMIRLARAGRWGQLTPASIQAALHKLRLARDGRRPVGLATVNHYLQSLKGFCNWMISDYRAERSPCLSVRPYNPRLDVRHARRNLTKEEVLQLITAAKDGPVLLGVPGPERALGYLLAATTGLRSAEIQSLTRGSFFLDGPGGPHIKVRAAYTKNRHDAEIPLRADLANVLRGYLGDVGRDEQLFRRGRFNPMRMMRRDLAAAGISYRTAEGVADFHALRHTFISNLFSSGATPKEAQTAARHQDPRLTLGRYAHVQPDAVRAAIERLPAAGIAEIRAGRLVQSTTTPGNDAAATQPHGG